MYLLIIQTANLERARNLAPKWYSTNIAKTPKKLRPARTLTPFATPILMNSGGKRREPQASALRKKSFEANKDAAYCGYDIGL